MSKTYTKYKFRGLPLLVLGDDDKFYRLPFCYGLRSYGLKQLTPTQHKGVMKLLYLNKRYTKKKLSSLKENFKILIKEELSDRERLIKYISNSNVDLSEVF